MARALALLRQAARLQADRAADAAKAAAAAESLSGPYGASDPALMLGAADPHFVMELVREHMQHLGGEPLEAAALAHGEAAGDCLRAALRLLRGLLQTMPAHREAALALATAHYVGGDAPAAGRLCADMLARDPGHAAVHLLRARIALQVRAALSRCVLARALSFLYLLTHSFINSLTHSLTPHTHSSSST